MTTPYTADDLLEQVRDGGSLPATAVTGTADANLLRHADNELRDTLVPLMLGVHEEFYERVFDTTVVSGTAAYRINKRAALSRLNTVQWVGTDSKALNLQRIEPKQTAEYSVLTTLQGQPWGYYLEGARVALYPTPNLGGTLRIRAFVRPGRLTLTTDTANVAEITSVSNNTPGVYTINTGSAHGIGAIRASDIVNGTPSFEHNALDAQATSLGTTQVSMAVTDFLTAPVAGDFLTASDYTPVVQLPVELQPALVELVVARVLRALGKGSEAAQHADEAQRLTAIGIQALTPRVETADRKITGGPHFRRRVNQFRSGW